MWQNEYAKFFSRPHDAVTRVYDNAGNVIEAHQQSVVAAIRDQPHISFDPADITDIALTHRKWDFRHDSAGRDRATI